MYMPSPSANGKRERRFPFTSQAHAPRGHVACQFFGLCLKCRARTEVPFCTVKVTALNLLCNSSRSLMKLGMELFRPLVIRITNQAGFCDRRVEPLPEFALVISADVPSRNLKRAAVGCGAQTQFPSAVRLDGFGNLVACLG